MIRKLVLSRKVLLKQTQKTENEEKTQALHEVEQKGRINENRHYPIVVQDWNMLHLNIILK